MKLKTLLLTFMFLTTCMLVSGTGLKNSNTFYPDQNRYARSSDPFGQKAFGHLETVGYNEEQLSDESEVDVTIVLSFDDSHQYCSLFTLKSVDSDFRKSVYPRGNQFEISVPVGSYYAVATFDDFDYAMPVIIAKEVSIIGNEEFSFNINDATLEISFSPLLPSGIPLTVPITKYDEDYNKIVVEEGSINDGIYMPICSFVDGVEIYSGMIFLRTSIDENGNIDSNYLNFSFRTTENDFLIFSNNIFGINEEGTYMIYLVSDGKSSINIKNDILNYSFLKTEFGTSVHEIPDIDEKFPFINPSLGSGSAFISHVTGTNIFGDFGYGIENTEYPTGNIYVCTPPTDKVYNELTSLIWPVPLKYIYYSFDPYNQGYIIGAPMGKTNDGFVSVINHNNAIASSNNEIYDRSPIEKNNNLISNIWFEYENDFSQVLELGKNTPITVISVTKNNYIDYQYIGRFSENRTIDNLYDTVNLKINNVTVASDHNQFEEILNEWWNNPLTSGKIEFSNVNNNISVEGLPGMSSSITLFDITDSPFSVPVLQMLQFKDNEDNVTDIFSSSEDVNINFSAGGFIFQNSESGNNSYFSYEELSQVTLEFAPYGSNNFNELQISEIPEKFFMPGYGAFYTANLSEIENLNNGWYDIRISLETEKGATQVQTISPAFKIEGSTYVKSVNKSPKFFISGNRICLEGFSPEEISLFSIDGKKIENRNILPGFYIVKAGEIVSKQYIK